MPGGLCATFEVDGYRFEPGGGHWIFGANPLVIEWLSRFCELKKYERRSAVLANGWLVPYPLQHNLWALDPDIQLQALCEIDPHGDGETMDDWLYARLWPRLRSLPSEQWRSLQRFFSWRSSSRQWLYG